MLKVCLTLLVLTFAWNSPAIAGQPSAKLQKELREWNVIYTDDVKVRIDGDEKHAWRFAVGLKGTILPMVTLEGATEKEIKSSLLTLCCLHQYLLEVAEKQAKPEASPSIQEMSFQ